MFADYLRVFAEGGNQRDGGGREMAKRQVGSDAPSCTEQRGNRKQGGPPAASRSSARAGAGAKLGRRQPREVGVVWTEAAPEYQNIHFVWSRWRGILGLGKSYGCVYIGPQEDVVRMMHNENYIQRETSHYLSLSSASSSV